MTFLEPAYATAVDWLVCDALGRIASGPAETTTAVPAENGAYYFRLSTRPLDQAPFAAAPSRIGEAVLRRQVLAGAYRLVDASVPATAARRRCTWPRPAPCCPRCSPPPPSSPTRVSPRTSSTSPPWTGCTPRGSARCGTASAPRPPRRSPARCARRSRAGAARHRARRGLARHGLARLGARRPGRAARRGPVRPVGQRPELYELHDLLPGSIVNAALAALSLA